MRAATAAPDFALVVVPASFPLLLPMVVGFDSDIMAQRAQQCVEDSAAAVLNTARARSAQASRRACYSHAHGFETKRNSVNQTWPGGMQEERDASR